MNSERKAFEMEMEKLIGKVLSIKYSEEDGGYIAHDLMKHDESTKMLVNVFNFSWLMWQASASRQGYKLVPVENIKSIYEACNNALDINNIDIYKGLAMAIIDDYKAMIGAVDED